MVLFPDVAQLDVTGPYEIFARMPATRVYLVAPTLAPVRSEQGLPIAPDATFDAAPALDVICVPGGVGVNAAMNDEALLRFLQNQARHARYVTSVCTGALLLGAAGLLRGYRATTHWLSLDLLSLFGAQPVEQRIVIDGNRITAGGGTAGIDVGLTIASELFDTAVAPGKEQSLRTLHCERADRHDTLESFVLRSDMSNGIAIGSLEPGTTLVVNTRNSRYRFVVLLDPRFVLVEGGAMFREPAIVRLEGAAAGGSALKMGWILVGFQMEMRLGSVPIRSSAVRSVSIENVPAACARDCCIRA